LEVDTVIIGGKPVARFASLSVKRNGAKNVLMLEKEDELGGISK
jgi:thioredoxin reductase